MSGTERENPRDRPQIRDNPPAGRRLVEWLNLYGVWVWRLLVVSISIAGPLIVYFFTIDNRLAAVEQGVSGLDERVTKIEGQVSNIENQVRDIDYRLRDVEEDLDQLTAAVAALDEKVDRIIIALARSGTDVGSAPSGTDGSEPAD